MSQVPTPLESEHLWIYAAASREVDRTDIPPAPKRRARSSEEPSGDPVSRTESAIHALAEFFSTDEGRPYLLDANLAVMKYPHGGRAFLRANPNALVEIVVALECYVNDEGHSLEERLRRLEELALVHRTSALALVDGTHDPWLAAVRPFFEADALARYASDLEFQTHPIPDQALSLTTHLDVRLLGKSWDTPIDYAGMLAGVAELSERELGEAAFSCIVPEERDGHYRLGVHLAGSMWEVVLADEGPWPNAPAMVGLLNTVVRELGSEHRFTLLEPLEGDEQVIWARMSSGERAIDDALLKVSVFDFETEEDHDAEPQL